ncbi:hypothetical protein Patl1_03790 [Pistacia atlantica]|uniref:Uncharacterized protein n=1 Tax=Pistacia atlantica TaxID=434234 RepID=A0ACC1BTM3_9ROSI|nr:hypothetical protein Patl1_03790 [Pistacia atlantica]
MFLQACKTLSPSMSPSMTSLGNCLTPHFFRKLPLSDLASNRGLYISGGVVASTDGLRHAGQARSAMKLVMSILISGSAVLLLLAIYVLVRTRVASKRFMEDETWEMTLYQKLEFSIDDIVRSLTSANVIGTGSSGVVYRVTIPNGETLAVKKMWSSEESGAFNSEIQTLGSIRHKNIVRLLGWGSNKNLKLLFYDYLPNGSLSSLLHGAGGKGGADWDARYDVVLGVAHALAYLHHDCVPAILHGDVKAMNVLLGSGYQPYLADFGLARMVNSNPGDGLSKPSQRPQLAGSYRYMAPASKRDPADILDPKLRGRADPIMHEMLQTLAVSFLCISIKADDRPMMKDVVAMLIEIRHVESTRPENDISKGQLSSTPPQSLPPPSRLAVSQGSSHCSFTFSDESV